MFYAAIHLKMTVQFIRTFFPLDCSFFIDFYVFDERHANHINYSNIIFLYQSPCFHAINLAVFSIMWDFITFLSVSLFLLDLKRRGMFSVTSIRHSDRVI